MNTQGADGRNVNATPSNQKKKRYYLLEKRLPSILGLTALISLSVYYYEEKFLHTYVTLGENYRDTSHPIRASALEATRDDHCRNILNNLTRGRWVKKISQLDSDSEHYRDLLTLESDVEAELHKVRLRNGMEVATRKDSKCGYMNVIWQASSRGLLRGSWCDPDSHTPCCSDEDNGLCKPDLPEFCDCERCVDRRKLLHPDVADWIPSDTRCRRRNYTGFETCQVLSKFDEVHFIGDSMIRKVYEAFIRTMKSDPERGLWRITQDESMEKQCVGNNQFYHPKCKISKINFPLSDLPDKSNLCEGKMKVAFKYIYQQFSQKAQPFLNLIQDISGKSKTLVVFCFGVNINYNADFAIKEVLTPAFEYLEKLPVTDMRWPKLVFVTPDPPGILKPTVYAKAQGRIATAEYSRRVTKFCQEHNVSVLDFAELTKNLHSYDGTHFGRGANLMKVQILLNYLDTL